jgi:hypothetical protein
MKHADFLKLTAILLVFTAVLLLLPAKDAQALPEYAAQTGETCAACHISPSGGGARTPRGQGWIAADKPGTVPDLLSSLELLGVELDIDPAEFNDVPDEIVPAQPLLVEPGQADLLHQHLFNYPGN